MDNEPEIELPENLADGITARIQEVDRQSQGLNAYVQGIADTLGVTPGWQFDRDRLVFLNPQKGDDK